MLIRAEGEISDFQKIHKIPRKLEKMKVLIIAIEK
jgi:hypothetical protein